MQKTIKLLLFLLPTLLFSCLWLDGTTIDGEHKTRSDYIDRLKQEIQNKTPQSKLEEVERIYSYDKKTLLEQEEHEAVVLILKGDYSHAIKELLILEDKYPNKYSIASNLGTTYELEGDNKKALTWIEEGIKRNSDAHYGTEWLHLYILELKIKLEKNPNLLKKQRAISLPLEFKSEDSVQIGEGKYTIEELKIALEYQLRERITFIKPKNEIMADLFYTSMRILAQTETVEDALNMSDVVLLYGFFDIELLEQKRSFYQEIKDNPSLFYIFHDLIDSVLPIVILLILALFLFWVLKKIYNIFFKREI